MKASMKIMAAGVVAVMLMAGIAGTLAYSATVVNNGNSADIKATDIGFFNSSGECDEGAILKDIGSSSTRTYTNGAWTTAWEITDTKLTNDIVVKVVSGDNVNSKTGTFTVTISGVAGGDALSNNDFVATFGSVTGTVGIASGVMTVTFTGSTELPIVINNTSGTSLNIEINPDSAQKFVGFSISNSTVTATFSS